MTKHLLDVLSSLLQNRFKVLPEEDLGGAEGIAVPFVGGGVVVQDHPADLLRWGTPWDPSLQQTAVSVLKWKEKRLETLAKIVFYMRKF